MNSLGYIKTARARDKLRHWFRQQDRSKNLEVGRELLNKELSRLAIHLRVSISTITRHILM